jgi:hypothetical protein
VVAVFGTRKQFFGAAALRDIDARLDDLHCIDLRLSTNAAPYTHDNLSARGSAGNFTLPLPLDRTWAADGSKKLIDLDSNRIRLAHSVEALRGSVPGSDPPVSTDEHNALLNEIEEFMVGAYV